MNSFDPKSQITRDEERRELHWLSSGLWSVEQARDLVTGLGEASQYFLERRLPFRVLGDLRGFSVQSQEVVDVMKYSQDNAAKVGVDRMAIVHTSTLVKIQFRRISDGLEVEFFPDTESALSWLREGK